MQPIKWEMPNRGVIIRVALAAGLFASFLNAYSESMEYRYALLFMFSHYALFIAGFALSYRSVAFPKWAVLPASFLVVYWHLPAPFALSAAIQSIEQRVRIKGATRLEENGLSDRERGSSECGDKYFLEDQAVYNKMYRQVGRE